VLDSSYYLILSSGFLLPPPSRELVSWRQPRRLSLSGLGRARDGARGRSAQQGNKPDLVAAQWWVAFGDRARCLLVVLTGRRKQQPARLAKAPCTVAGRPRAARRARRTTADPSLVCQKITLAGPRHSVVNGFRILSSVAHRRLHYHTTCCFEYI
jgi:hypothetical protein